MKAVMVIYEGAADVPQGDLDGHTPLQIARCPSAAALVASGRSGTLKPVRDALKGRNEVMLAQLLGAKAEDAKQLHRGPVEAESLPKDEVAGYAYAYRGNFVTLDDDRLNDGRVGSLSYEETRSLAGALNTAWTSGQVKFVATGPARVVVLCRTGDVRTPGGTPPCFIEGERIDRYMAGGAQSFLQEVLDRSNEVLLRQTLNEVRLDLGENPANAVWLWGGGVMGCGIPSSPVCDPQIDGLVLTQSAMAAGIGHMSGMDVVTMDDPWRCATEDPAFNVSMVAERVKKSDFILVYVEAPKKLGQYGTAKEKVRALESMDRYVLKPLIDVLGEDVPYRIALCTDSLVSTKTCRPVSAALPFVISGEGFDSDGLDHWDEVTATRGSLGRVKVTRLVRTLVKDD